MLKDALLKQGFTSDIQSQLASWPPKGNVLAEMIVITYRSKSYTDLYEL